MARALEHLHANGFIHGSFSLDSFSVDGAESARSAAILTDLRSTNAITEEVRTRLLFSSPMAKAMFVSSLQVRGEDVRMFGDVLEELYSKQSAEDEVVTKVCEIAALCRSADAESRPSVSDLVSRLEAAVASGDEKSDDEKSIEDIVEMVRTKNCAGPR